MKTYNEVDNLKRLKTRVKRLEKVAANFENYLQHAKRLLAVPAEFHTNGLIISLPFFEALNLPLNSCHKRDIMKALGYNIVGIYQMRPYRRKSQIYSNQNHNPKNVRELAYTHISQFRAACKVH